MLKQANGVKYMQYCANLSVLVELGTATEAEAVIQIIHSYFL